MEFYMPDLSTEYLGLKIKNPLIISSCGLTSEVEKIQQFEKVFWDPEKELGLP